MYQLLWYWRLDHAKAGVRVLSLRFFCSCYFLYSSVGKCIHIVLAWVRNALLRRNSRWSVLTLLGSYHQAALEHTANMASFLMELKQNRHPKNGHLAITGCSVHRIRLGPAQNKIPPTHALLCQITPAKPHS